MDEPVNVCPNCGSSMPVTAAFCSSCGARIGGDVARRSMNIVLGVLMLLVAVPLALGGGGCTLVLLFAVASEGFGSGEALGGLFIFGLTLGTLAAGVLLFLLADRLLRRR